MVDYGLHIIITNTNTMTKHTHTFTNQYRREQYEQAQALARELSTYYPAHVTVDREEHSRVIITRNGTQYQVHKNYHGHYIAQPAEYKRRDNVSTRARSDVYEKYKTKNMKVLSQRKLDAKLDAVDAEEAELDALQNTAANKRAAFLATIEACGLPCTYSHNYTYGENNERIRGEITGGEIEKNGIVYTFTIHNDGYISQDIKTHYAIQNTLDTFQALSNNAYRGNM